jgi:hypothetical protein
LVKIKTCSGSFILNNFGLSPSASNPGDGVSEVVLSLAHQRGKKKQAKTKLNQTKPNKKKTPQSVPSSNAIQFQ